MQNLNFYLDKIRRLNRNRNHGTPAPHKPLLLLAVIDLIEQGKVLNNQFAPTTAFTEAFLKYWNLLKTERPRIFLPFYYLKSEGFWHLHAKENGGVFPFRSMTQTAENIAFASLDENLFVLLTEPPTREIIRRAIIETYFPDEKEIFRAAINENQQNNSLEKLLADLNLENQTNSAKPKRSRLFRGVIMRLYDYTCAACRFRLVTLDGETAVEAAHIHPFAQSFDDSIGNGLSLCPLHHWSFDKGLFSIDDNYKMLVSNQFEETGNEASLLRSLEKKEIYLPKEKPFRPSLTMLRWHRENLFNS